MLPYVYNQIALFLKVELTLGVMLTDWWSVSLPEHARFPSIPPVLFRFFVRCFVLAIYVFFAVATLSMGIGNIQGLIGALAGAGFSFCRPWILYWRVFRNEMSLGRKGNCFFWFMLGVSAAILGTYSLVRNAKPRRGARAGHGSIQVCLQCGLPSLAQLCDPLQPHPLLLSS